MTLATIRKYKNMEHEVNSLLVSRRKDIRAAHRMYKLLEALGDAHFYLAGEKKRRIQDLRAAKKNARKGIRPRIEISRLFAEEI